MKRKCLGSNKHNLVAHYTYKGEFSLITTGDLITSTRCKVDGITYRIGRTQYELLEGHK